MNKNSMKFMIKDTKIHIFSAFFKKSRKVANTLNPEGDICGWNSVDLKMLMY